MNFPSTALVTGATGAIGNTLVRQLLDKGYRVRVLVRRPLTLGALPECVEVVFGDVNDSHALDRATTSSDVVYHLASILHINNPSTAMHHEIRRTNVEGTRHVVEACQSAGVRRLVFFSTVSVYGCSTNDEVLDENSPLRPQSIYAETKCQAEQIVLSAKQSGSDKPLGVILRLAAVYGPRMKGNYARLVGALRGRWFLPIGSCLNRRTLVFDRDVASAALIAAEHQKAAGEVYNITDGRVHTLREILEAICAALGRQPPRYKLPAGPCGLMAGLVEDGFRIAGKTPPFGRATIDKFLEDIAVSGKKVQRDLGFLPQFGLSAGWAHTIQKMLRMNNSSA